MKKSLSVRIEHDDPVLAWLIKKANDAHLSVDKTIYAILKDAIRKEDEDEFIAALCMNFSKEILSIKSEIRKTIQEELSSYSSSVICKNEISRNEKGDIPSQTLDFLNHMMNG